MTLQKKKEKKGGHETSNSETVSRQEGNSTTVHVEGFLRGLYNKSFNDCSLGLQFCKHRSSRDSRDTKPLFQTWSLQIAGNYIPETHRRPKLTLRGLTRASRYRVTSDRRDVVYEIKY